MPPRGVADHLAFASRLSIDEAHLPLACVMSSTLHMC